MKGEGTIVGGRGKASVVEEETSRSESRYSTGLLTAMGGGETSVRRPRECQERVQASAGSRAGPASQGDRRQEQATGDDGPRFRKRTMNDE